MCFAKSTFDFQWCQSMKYASRFKVFQRLAGRPGHKEESKLRQQNYLNFLMNRFWRVDFELVIRNWHGIMMGNIEKT